jgi:uncharacterized protein (DUF2267 family)
MKGAYMYSASPNETISMYSGIDMWLKDIMDRTGWQDRQKAYDALGNVLHVVRDRLAFDDLVNLGAMLPKAIRRLYYEGWSPRNLPNVAKRHGIVDEARRLMKLKSDIEVIGAIQAVLGVVENHIASDVDDQRQ